MNTKILELENMIESDFNPELFEKKVYEICWQLDDVDDCILLANLARWAEFDDEDKGAEMAGNIMDRGIELAVKEPLNTCQELKYSELGNKLVLNGSNNSEGQVTIPE